MRSFILTFLLFSIAFLTFSEDKISLVQATDLKNSTCEKDSIPAHLEASFLKALEFYPELADQKIRFKNAKIKTTLNVRPTLKSLLFHKKENREYVIRINTSAKNEEILITDIPHNAKVGLFGHELAHIVDYKSLNTFQVMGRGIGYMFPGYHEAYEKHVDLLTVKAGLGQRLYDWASYIQEHPHVPENYKLFKQQFYLEQDDILHAIKEVNLGTLSSDF